MRNMKMKSREPGPVVLSIPVECFRMPLVWCMEVLVGGLILSYFHLRE